MNILLKSLGIVTQYSENHGIQLKWTDVFEIKTTACYNEVQISAKQRRSFFVGQSLFNLAQDDFPCGTHIHLD